MPDSEKSCEKKITTPTIATDRVSLLEFDRHLAAGPEVPKDLPNQKNVHIIHERNAGAGVRFGHNVENDAEVTDVIIGLDVGSTATKMVLRLPYSDDIGLPVPAPEWFRAEGRPYYWRTLLWRLDNGEYSIEPHKGATPIDRLKVDLLDLGRSDRMEVKAAMVAWVVLMARQGIGWLRNERPHLFRSSKVVVDEVNLGMPFTTVADAHRGQVQVAKAAGRILEVGYDVSESTIVSALQSEYSEGSDLVALQPELTGALHGFLKSHQARDGRYLLTDIGGLTIDTVFFKYYEDAKPPITVYAKSVECFGSEVISKWCEHSGNTERATKVLGNHIAEVSKRAISEKIYISAEDLGRPLELETILIGGGRHSTPYRDSIEWCQASMANHAPPLDLRLRDLEPDRDDLDVPLAFEQGVSRLLVAMGLSYSRYDAPDTLPPSEVADVERKEVKDISGDFVGPEQC